MGAVPILASENDFDQGSALIEINLRSQKSAPGTAVPGDNPSGNLVFIMQTKTFLSCQQSVT